MLMYAQTIIHDNFAQVKFISHNLSIISTVRSQQGGSDKIYVMMKKLMIPVMT